MRKIVFQTILIYLITVVTAFGQPPVWYVKLLKLQPLVSDKTDVEKVFENPKVDKNFIDGGIEAVYYETSDGKLTVLYSSGDCTFGRTNDFQTTKGKVINILFFPINRRIKISKFNINKQNLETRTEHEGTTYLTDNEIGIEYGTQKERVIHIKMFPSSKYENMRCKLND